MNLTQQSFTSSQFCKSEVQQNMTGFSALGITRLKKAGLSSCLETLGRTKSASHLILGVGRIKFLAVVGLRSLFPCWLLVRGHSRQTRGFPHSLSQGPLQPEMTLPIVPRLQISDFPSLWPPDPDCLVACGIRSGPPDTFFVLRSTDW